MKRNINDDIDLYKYFYDHGYKYNNIFTSIENMKFNVTYNVYIVRDGDTIESILDKYDVDIELHYKDYVIDLKSILGLMSLAVPAGTNVKVVATGNQAEEAIKDIQSILE